MVVVWVDEGVRALIMVCKFCNNSFSCLLIIVPTAINTCTLVRWYAYYMSVCIQLYNNSTTNNIT